MSNSSHKFFSIITAITVAALCMAVPLKNIAYAENELEDEAWSLADSNAEVLYAKIAIVRVVNTVTGKLTVQPKLAGELEAPELAGKSYEFNIKREASGFFVQDDGYIITNGHIVKPGDELVAYHAISGLAELIYKDAIRVYYKSLYGYEPAEDEMGNYFQMILSELYEGSRDNMVHDLYESNYLSGDLKMSEMESVNYVVIGTAGKGEDAIEKYGKPVEVINTFYDNSSGLDDLALIKVEGAHFPALDASKSKSIHAGDEVFLIGYPAVDESLEQLVDDEGDGASVFRTSLSAKEDTDILYLDEDIDVGVSGGVVVDVKGNLLGVATSSFTGGYFENSVNFVVPMDEVNRMLSENNITSVKGEVNEEWEQALDQYSRKCYSAAKRHFEAVKELYPDNPDVGRFSSECQQSIDQGEDVCLARLRLWTTIVIVTVFVGLLGVGGVFIWKSSKLKAFKKFLKLKILKLKKGKKKKRSK